MNKNQVSLTALISAFGRAYHSKQAAVKIFDDFLAESMMSSEKYNEMGHNLANAITFFDPEFAAGGPDEKAALARVLQLHSSAITLCRAAYTEEVLEAAVDGGMDQYVILGAGLDTFAFRRPDLMKKLSVFELDHPATQQYKVDRLRELGWEIPGNLHMIPVDFSIDSLTDVLKKTAFDSCKPALFSWLGITYYLTLEDVISALKNIADISSSASMVIFDYLDKDAFDPEKVSLRVRKMIQITGMAGEPMKTGFSPDEIAELASSIGLLRAENLSPDDVQLRWFSTRNDGMTAFEHVNIARFVKP